jgi:hypothetical protein
MYIKIYQINRSRDDYEPVIKGLTFFDRFSDTDNIDSSIYDEVFSGDVPCESLEEIYTMFNVEGHALYRGRPMNTADIIEVNNEHYYVRPLGFTKVNFDPSQTVKPDNLLKIVYVEPHKKPFVSEVEDTLEALQRAVGDGLIEDIYNGDMTSIVCNDESKLRGMEGNRRIGDGSSIIAGPFFVVGINGENYRSLSDAEVDKYLKMFDTPEDISQEEVEEDMGFVFMSW